MGPMAIAAPKPAPGAAPLGARSALATPAQRAYALALLLLIYVFNFVDRSILGILLEPIKREFNPSDTALGILSGIAFALIYSTLGVPIALWADRGSRKTIISLSLLVWSGMTAVCGLVTSFWQLVAARIGVGVGEAGCSPPAHSMISDYFPPTERGRAFGIYSLGIPIGGSFGVLAGGWINEWFDWRTAFLVVGLPGVALAILSQLTLREPVRGSADGVVAHGAAPRAGAVARHLWARPSFRHLSLAGALHALVGYGVGAWNAAFLMRTHGMGTGEIGTWLAGIGLVAGGLGTYYGGALADRLSPRDARWNVWVPGIAILVAMPFSLGFYLLPWKVAALLSAVPAAFLGATYLGPTFATTQALAELRMRAVASAVLLFVLNLIGMGLGPVAVGVASDLFARGAGLGAGSLRWALIAVALVNVWSAVHYLLAARTLRADLASVKGS
jgi:MFS family permease